MVVAADHVGDPHVGVVDRDREVVEDGAVRPGDHRVVLEAVLKADLAPDRVGDDGLPLVRDTQADRRARLRSLGLAAIALIGARLAEGLDICARCGVAVGVARLEQLRQSLGVALGPPYWLIGPSSQSSSSQLSASRICSTFSSVDRSRSVSSIRRTSFPPVPRAASQL